MLLLVTDTSGRDGFVGLVRAGGTVDTVDVMEEAPLAGGTFSAQLVPQIATLLEKRGLRKTDIDAFVVVSGPGSFTGLRVGLAAIKGLAEILHKPIVAVSLLEAVALASRAEGRVLAVLDGGREEIYAGEYDVTGESARMVSERLLSRDEFLAQVPGLTVATPDSRLAEIARDAGLNVVAAENVNLGKIAQLGWSRMRAGQTVSPEALEANYIRRTDAEIFAKPASN